MTEKTYCTACGEIHYWISENLAPEKKTLIFLPGLTADHRLFEKQLEHFEGRYNVFVWDAPGHAASWPFKFDFDLADKARWLDGIIEKEKLKNLIIVGQSMGGYLGQMYMELFPGKLKGFISIDSAPLKCEYYTKIELWLLKKMEPVYRLYPWKALKKSGTEGVACSEYGRALMRDIMSVYDGDQSRYAKLAGHGFEMLANAVETGAAFNIDCPALLICGQEDKAGSAKRYNRRWHERTLIPIEWIEGAGHNSNTDKPELVNALIEGFAGKIS